MSAEVIRSFFPILLPQAESNSHVAPLINALFPKYIQKMCPVPAIHLQGNFELKWPTVAVACIAGGLLSLLAGGRMICRSASKKGFFTWGFALFWYGIMCLGGLFYHCIKPSVVFRNVDVIATACSSISVVAGSILADDTALSQRLPLLVIYVSTAVAAIGGVELVPEFLYLGPTAVAFVAAAWFIWRVFTGNGVKWCEDMAVKWWCALAAGGAIVGLGSVVCDKWLCLMLGSNFLLYFFVGCNIALFGLCQIVIELQNSAREDKHS
ncbi:hypothetical protein SUGI_0036310 [Cryptomeria japonica]|uniref:uncharacterized protein LOC131075734 n=1 Tax=Cryptomeria japonica TaxID=3369 RepID=UPI002408CE43|nr:uncharacterized protein LOC131075734 [Cryptomeria japonica]GLJ06319.1 hypothetical protein SUGI_0036310 [Cryptomeria japonica]